MEQDLLEEVCLTPDDSKSVPVTILNVPSNSCDVNPAQFDDADLDPITKSGDSVTLAALGVAKFRIGHLQCQTVLLPRPSASPRSRKPTANHHFINTGDGAVLSLAFSDMYRAHTDQARVLAVAKSDANSVLRNAAASSLQLWTVSSRKPSKSSLLRVYRIKNSLITQVRWACDPSTADAQKFHLLAMVDAQGAVTLREFSIEPGSGTGSSSSSTLVTQCVLLKLEAGARFTCLDICRAGEIIHLLTGNTDGLTVMYRYKYTPGKLALLGSSSAALTKTPITAVAWLPGTDFTFYAVGTSLGTFAIGDRRKPATPRLLATDYASRPIVSLSPGNVVGTVVGSHVTGFIYSTVYLESSHHHPLKALADTKVAAFKPEKGSDSRWIRAMIPEHRRPLAIRALEQPSTACGAVHSEALWTFEDGSLLTGFLPELDRKGYQSSGVVQWSLVEPVQDTVEPQSLVSDTKELVEHTTQSIERCCKLGLMSARQDGVLLLLSSYHALLAAYKQHARLVPNDLTPNKVLASAYILRLSAVAELKSFDGAYFAYGGALGLIHILPCGLFKP